MKRGTGMVLAVLLACGPIGTALGATRWVNDDDPNGGSYDPPGTSCDDPGYETIEDALGAADPGDTIMVCPGTYSEAVDLTGPGHNGITLRGFPGTVVNGVGVGTAGVGPLALLNLDGVDQVTIKDLEIHHRTNYEAGEGVRGEATNLVLQNLTFVGGRSHAINIFGSSSNVVIQDIDVGEFDADSIEIDIGFGPINAAEAIRLIVQGAFVERLTCGGTARDPFIGVNFSFGTVGSVCGSDIEADWIGVMATDNSVVEITGNYIHDCVGRGVHVTCFGDDGPDSVTVNHNNIVGNGTFGPGCCYGGLVNITNLCVTSVFVDAENNWWGAVNGPSGDFGGSGDRVFHTFGGPASVDVDPWEEALIDPLPDCEITPKLTLEPDADCYANGETVTVDIWMRNIAETIVGGQFFLEYDDSKLSFVSAVPVGPFLELFEDTSPGLIDYAVFIDPPGSETGDAHMATLTFTAVGQLCTEGDLITFRDHDPPTRLTDDQGDAVNPLKVDLDVIDDEAPTIACPDNFAVQCADDMPGAYADLAAFIAAGGSADDNCDDALTLSLTSDSGLVGGACGGTVTRVYRVTDDCNNNAECTQVITVDDTIDPTIACPDNIGPMNADAGGCTLTLSAGTIGTPTVDDNCDGSPDITWVRSDGASDLDDPFDEANSPITITWRVTDDCGNFSECGQTITVSDLNEVHVTVELEPTVVTTVQRCITFELWDCPDTVPIEIVSMELTGGGGGQPWSATGDFTVACGEYDCITARDKLHTLRRTAAIVDTGTEYTADFTGADELIGGNLNDDFWIDILDFGVFSSEWAEDYSTGDTTCATPFPHADISGNGIVSTEDFTFIQINFLEGHEPNCCGAGGRGVEEGGDGPITEISVRQLRRMGLGHLAVGDLNRDGLLNAEDIAAFMAGARPQPQPGSAMLQRQTVPVIEAPNGE